MRFRNHCLLIAITCLSIWAGGLVYIARAEVIEGAYTNCYFPWGAWAQNASFYDRADSIYEIAHGDSSGFAPGCGRPVVTPAQVQAKGYSLGFFASCDGLCSNANGTLSESVEESVGYCGMGEVACDVCWTRTVAFQDIFYREKRNGQTGQESFDAAMNAVPECIHCLRYHKKRAPEEPNPTQIVMTTIIVPWLMRNR